jgi:nucleoside-diphosphate-sugar epimerase
MTPIEPINDKLCLKDINVAITGGAGFIDRSLAEVLISRGANVIAIDNLCNGKLENIAHMLDHPSFFFVKADLKNLTDSFGYSYIFGFRSAIIRLANIVGPFSNHGITFDFLEKLCLDPYRLEVLGDGKQNKSYLCVNDCIKAILLIYRHLDNNDSTKNIQIFNVGSEDKVDVFLIILIIAQEMGIKDIEINCSRKLNDGRGWLGDVKYMLLDTSKIKALGWIGAIRRTAREILAFQSATQMKTQKHIERMFS